MEIRGNIRRGTSGVDIAFPNQGRWESLSEGPLRDHIVALYDFLLSTDNSRIIHGVSLTKSTREYGDGNARTEVTSYVVFGAITLIRFSKDMMGNDTPSDKVSLRIIIPTEEQEQFTQTYQAEEL